MIDYHEAKKIDYKVYHDARSELHLTAGWAEVFVADESSAKIIRSTIFEKANVPTSSSFGVSVPFVFSVHPTYRNISVLALPGIRQVSYKFSQQVNARKYDYSFQGTFLQNAILMKYNLIPYGKKLRLSLFAGPNVRLIVGNKSSVSEIYRNTNSQDTLLVLKTFTLRGGLDVDVFVALDLGYQFNNGSVLYAGIRNQFNPFQRTFAFGTRGLDFTIQSHPISLFLGYRPKIKSRPSALKQ